MRAWCQANAVELVFLPTYSSWLNWMEAEFTALRYFALNGRHLLHVEPLWRSRFGYAAVCEGSMTFVAGLISMGSIDPRQISARASDQGLEVYFISTPTGMGMSEFFDSARAVLPLDPPLVSDNWDAFIDSLDSGIADLESPGAVIVWADARNLQRASPNDSRVAMACLARVTEHVANPDWTPHPKLLSVFVNIDQGDHWSDQWPYIVLGNDFLEENWRDH